MKQIGGWITRIISNIGDEAIESEVRDEVRQLCLRFPIPSMD